MRILGPILSIPIVLEVSSKDNSENTSDSGIKISLIVIPMCEAVIRSNACTYSIKETTEGSSLIGGSVNEL